jgi:hypothetical protein
MLDRQINKPVNKCQKFKQSLINNIIYCCKYNKINLVKLVLTFTWYWAYIGLKLTKLFEFFFMIILYIPDQLYLSEQILPATIKNSNNEKVKIIYARNDYGEITNKMKFFLRWYWENVNDESIHENNGFDITQLTKLFNCSMLYCSYLLIKNDEVLTPELFLTNIKNILILKQEEERELEREPEREPEREREPEPERELEREPEREQQPNPEREPEPEREPDREREQQPPPEQDDQDDQDIFAIDKILNDEKNKVYVNKKNYVIKQIIGNITTIKNIYFDHVDFMD